MAQTESWYWLDDHGQLMLHTENDGYACMRHGLCARDMPVDIDSLDDRELRRALSAVLADLRRLREGIPQ